MEESQPLLQQRASANGHDAAASQKASTKRSTLLTVCPYILGNELCERLCFYGVATNMVVYITKVMGGDPAFAAIMVAVFEGTSYTTPVIGALLADSVWGRYKTIMVFSFVYLVGIIMLTLSSMIPDTDDDAETANPVQYGVLLGSLAIISLGTGGIKPNVSAFGADQFNEACPQDRKEKESFFNWFYLAINVGSLFASTVIVYIQDQISWTVGFAIPGVAMAMAIVLFWAGRKGYRHVLPTESPMTRVVKVVAAAVKNRYRKQHTPNPSVSANQVIAGGTSPPASEVGSYHGGRLYQQAVLDTPPSYMSPSPTMRSNGRNTSGPFPAANMPRNGSIHQMPVVHSMSYRWLEDAVTEWQTSRGELVHTGSLAGYTPKQVEEVKLVIRLLPIFFTTVLYWTIYTQMSTLFVQQGNLMNRQVAWNGQSFKIPSASMSLINILSVILCVWLYDAFLDPMLRKTQRFKMTLLRRIGWGMLIATLSMLYAGGLEHWRLSTLSGLPPCPPGSCTSFDPSNTSLAAAPVPVSHDTTGAGIMGFGGITAAGRRMLYAAGAGRSLVTATETGSTFETMTGNVADMQCLCPDQPSPLSIFWQVPSYFLIGLSEVFTSIGQLEFFYDQAPDVMRSCSMALCLLSTGIGSYLAGGLTASVQAFSKLITGCEWLPRDLNRGHMDLFFYVLTAAMLLNMLGFLAVAVRYQYKAVQHKKHLQPPLVDSTGAPEPTSLPEHMGALADVPGRVPPARTARGVMAPPGTQPTTAPLAIGPRGPFTTRPGAPAMAVSATDSDMTDMEVYSRSLAFVPPSPNIPAPFR